MPLRWISEYTHRATHQHVYWPAKQLCVASVRQVSLTRLELCVVKVEYQCANGFETRRGQNLCVMYGLNRNYGLGLQPTESLDYFNLGWSIRHSEIKDCINFGSSQRKFATFDDSSLAKLVRVLLFAIRVSPSMQNRNLNVFRADVVTSRLFIEWHEFCGCFNCKLKCTYNDALSNVTTTNLFIVEPSHKLEFIPPYPSLEVHGSRKSNPLIRHHFRLIIGY